MPSTRTARIKRLKEIYDRLPKINCTKQCWQYCCTVAWLPAEKENLRRSRNLVPELLDPGTLQCQYLHLKLCSVHEDRPLICRLFGIVPRMPCPFGCVPERWLTEAEASEFIREVQSL